jgi:hypothetical protein
VEGRIISEENVVVPFSFSREFVDYIRKNPQMRERSNIPPPYKFKFDGDVTEPGHYICMDEQNWKNCLFEPKSYRDEPDMKPGEVLPEFEFTSEFVEYVVKNPKKATHIIIPKPYRFKLYMFDKFADVTEDGRYMCYNETCLFEPRAIEKKFTLKFTPTIVFVQHMLNHPEDAKDVKIPSQYLIKKINQSNITEFDDGSYVCVNDTCLFTPHDEENVTELPEHGVELKFSPNASFIQYLLDDPTIIENDDLPEEYLFLRIRRSSKEEDSLICAGAYGNCRFRPKFTPSAIEREEVEIVTKSAVNVYQQAKQQKGLEEKNYRSQYDNQEKIYIQQREQEQLQHREDEKEKYREEEREKRILPPPVHPLLTSYQNEEKEKHEAMLERKFLESQRKSKLDGDVIHEICNWNGYIKWAQGYETYAKNYIEKILKDFKHESVSIQIDLITYFNELYGLRLWPSHYFAEQYGGRNYDFPLRPYWGKGLTRRTFLYVDSYDRPNSKYTEEFEQISYYMRYYHYYTCYIIKRLRAWEVSQDAIRGVYYHIIKHNSLKASEYYSYQLDALERDTCWNYWKEFNFKIKMTLYDYETLYM